MSPTETSIAPAAFSVAALDRLLPDARLVEIDQVDLAAPPEEVWRHVRHEDLARSPLVRALFAIRLMSRKKVSLRLDDLVSTAARPGFQVLVDEPPRQFAVGAIGKVWQPDIPFVHVDSAAEFAAFAAPGFVKVAWSIAFSPLDSGGCHLHLEVRVDATDEESWVKFRRYFRLIGIGSHLIRRWLLSGLERELGRAPDGAHPPRRDGWREIGEGLGGAARMGAAMLAPFRRRRRSRWGLSPALADRPYPGDQLVPEPLWGWTHGIEIAAPAAAVWPWVAQIGAGRGGFYSYQWLENLAGCEVTNADRLHPEWQVAVGDQLQLHPKMPGLPVVACEPGRYFVVHGAADPAAKASGKPWVAASWLFFLEDAGEGRCRLISRYRIDCSEDTGSRLAYGPTLLEPIGFAMDRRMLLGIQERAAPD